MHRSNLFRWTGPGGLLCTLAVVLMATSFASGAGMVVSVTDSGADAPITDAPSSQRENDKGGAIVPFGEDVFTFTDRTHQYNGARFTAAGALTTTDPGLADDVTIGLPSYLVGGEYISTRNNNRDNADFRLRITVNQQVNVFLLLDNRIGDNNNANPATLGNGIMDWVLNEGWTMMNTGISPNGQPDFGAVDEGGSISDFDDRPAGNVNLGVGAGVKINQFWTVWKKNFKPTEVIELKQQNAGGLNMYGVVITPEPATIGLLAGAMALGLVRRRR